MFHFNKDEPVNICNCMVMEDGDYQDLDLVPICKWETKDEIYTMVQAYFLKFGSWKEV